MEVRGHVFPKFLNFTSVEARKSIYRINIRSLFTTKHSTLSFLFCFPSSPFDGDHFATSESKMKSTRRVKILEDVPQVSAWLEREREDVVAVTDGGGKGGRGIERGEEKRREEKRREESVGVGLESVGDSCRGVAGSISVDRRHKLFQWTQSSGSTSDSFLLASLFVLLSSW